MALNRFHSVDSFCRASSRSSQDEVLPREIVFQISWAALLGLVCLVFASWNY
jgi:hypothetical protein